MSHLLEGFEEKSDGKFIFRCPYCGDSKVNKRKRRGALIEMDGGLGFKCVKCGLGFGFNKFLRDQDSGMHREYWMELARAKAGFHAARRDEELVPVATRDSTDLLSQLIAGEGPDQPLVAPPSSSAFARLERISSLRPDHAACRYLDARGFGRGSRAWTDLYWAEDFPEWRNSMVPDKEPLHGHEGRIVIPLVTKNGIEIGAQGRSLGGSGLRYITAVWSKTELPRYGEERIDWTQPIWLTEGPFDAMALRNGMGTLHADLSSSATKLGLDKRQSVLLFDNEPGSRTIADLLRKAVMDGWRVAFWRDRQADVGKDAAKAIMELDLEQDELFRIASGPLARVEMGRWLGRLA
jgi:hypothetical protein